MTAKLCKYGCNTMLDGFDEENRKFLEAGTGGLHTKERCQEAKDKAKKAAGPIPTTEYLEKLEQKNDHGNESFTSIPVADERPTTNRFVDHTQPQKLKLKVLTSTEAEGLALLYNTFGESHNIRFSQYQIAGSLYTIAVWYEE